MMSYRLSQVPWTEVAPGDATAQVEVRYAPGQVGQGDWDGRLTIGTADAGTERQRDDVYNCLRRDLFEERDRRLESHGFTFRQSHVLRVETHTVGEVTDSESEGFLQGRWKSPDLPSGLDFFEVFAACMAFMLLSQVITDGVSRNQVSGWNETLGTAGLRPGERILVQLGGLWLTGLGLMGLLCVGGLLAGPFVGWFVHPGRVLGAALMPLGSAVVLLWAVQSARDVRTATLQSMLPIVFVMYTTLGGFVLDLRGCRLAGHWCSRFPGDTPDGRPVWDPLAFARIGCGVDGTARPA